MGIAICEMRWGPQESRASGGCCVCCGRKFRSVKSVRWVEVIDGGSTVAAPGLGVDTNDPGYLGLFPVGVGCARKHFPGFTQWIPEFDYLIEREIESNAKSN
jgi:hypothetical protein